MRFQHAHDKQARIHPPEARLFTEQPRPEVLAPYVIHSEDGPEGGSYLAGINGGGDIPEVWHFDPRPALALRLTLPQASQLVYRCPGKVYMIDTREVER